MPRSTIQNVKRTVIGIGIAALIIAVAILAYMVWKERVASAERERDLLAQVIELQGQVDLGEGVILTQAVRTSSLEKTLSSLLDKNSSLQGHINSLIEDPVVVVRVETRFRDRIVYRNTPEDQHEGDVVGVDTGDDTNHVVDFDMTRHGFRVQGRTESLGPRVHLELEQVEPFQLDAVLTRERRNGRWNLFVEDISQQLDVTVSNFTVDDSFASKRFWERISVGAGVNSLGSVSMHAGFDIRDRTTIWAGPVWGAGEWGVGIGFTYRPFIRTRD